MIIPTDYDINTISQNRIMFNKLVFIILTSLLHTRTQTSQQYTTDTDVIIKEIKDAVNKLTVMSQNNSILNLDKFKSLHRQLNNSFKNIQQLLFTEYQATSSKFYNFELENIRYDITEKRSMKIIAIQYILDILNALKTIFENKDSNIDSININSVSKITNLIAKLSNLQQEINKPSGDCSEATNVTDLQSLIVEFQKTNIENDGWEILCTKTNEYMRRVGLESNINTEENNSESFSRIMNNDKVFFLNLNSDVNNAIAMIEYIILNPELNSIESKNVFNSKEIDTLKLYITRFDEFCGSVLFFIQQMQDQDEHIKNARKHYIDYTNETIKFIRRISSILPKELEEDNDLFWEEEATKSNLYTKNIENNIIVLDLGQNSKKKLEETLSLSKKLLQINHMENYLDKKTNMKIKKSYLKHIAIGISVALVVILIIFAIRLMLKR